MTSIMTSSHDAPDDEKWDFRMFVGVFVVSCCVGHYTTVVTNDDMYELSKAE